MANLPLGCLGFASLYCVDPCDGSSVPVLELGSVDDKLANLPPGRLAAVGAILFEKSN